MKKVLVCKESLPAETRVAVIPDDIKKLTRMGFEFTVVSGAGLKSGFKDADYEQAGAKIINDEKDGLKDAEIVVRILKPDSADGMNPDTVHISFLDPFNEKDLLNGFAKNNIQAVSLEMIPRTTLAQKMDVQSSQTSLAGYVAVLNAAARMPKILPMMVTPAGTINPARVFVIGVGVAGLQAIATAKRLGARVDAFDTRPVVEEQVKSLGANFVKIDLGEMGQTAQGYAKELLRLRSARRLISLSRPLRSSAVRHLSSSRRTSSTECSPAPSSLIWLFPQAATSKVQIRLRKSLLTTA